MHTMTELEERQKKVAERVKKYGEQLYHYTSFSALYGMLKNKEIWLGSTASMNDKLEIIDFVDRLYNSVHNSLGEEEKTKCDEFFMAIKERLLDEYPFAACFSKTKDDAALWERYSDYAKGVCIVFNSKALISLFFYQLVLFMPVLYSYDITEHEHYNLLCDYFKTQELKDFKNETGLIDSILASAYVHKHISFGSECEVRLVTLWKRAIEAANVDYIVADNRIKKVLRVDLEKLCISEQINFEDLIDQIIIASRSLQSPYELKEFILSLGLHKIAAKITTSKCPLR